MILSLLITRYYYLLINLYIVHWVGMDTVNTDILRTAALVHV